MIHYITKTSKTGHEYPALVVCFESGKRYNVPLPPSIVRMVIRSNRLTHAPEQK